MFTCLHLLHCCRASDDYSQQTWKQKTFPYNLTQHLFTRTSLVWAILFLSLETFTQLGSHNFLLLLNGGPTENGDSHKRQREQHNSAPQSYGNLSNFTNASARIAHLIVEILERRRILRFKNPLQWSAKRGWKHFPSNPFVQRALRRRYQINIITERQHKKLNPWSFVVMVWDLSKGWQ